MAMPQRDDTREAIKRLDALLEYAVMHGDSALMNFRPRQGYGGQVGGQEKQGV